MKLHLLALIFVANWISDNLNNTKSFMKKGHNLKLLKHITRDF